MSVPKMPCRVLSMPRQPTPLCGLHCRTAGPNSGKHDIHPALHYGLWPSLQPRCFYLCVSASLVKTAASSSASSCSRGFRQYRTKCHALYPSLVLLVRHQNIPPITTPDSWACEQPVGRVAKNLIDTDFWQPFLPGCSQAQTNLNPNSSLGHWTPLHVNSWLSQHVSSTSDLRRAMPLVFDSAVFATWHPVVIKNVALWSDCLDFRSFSVTLGWKLFFLKPRFFYL